MPNYTAPVEDMMFLFDKLRNNKNYNEIEKYKEVNSELVKNILDEAAKINQNIILPLAKIGDENPTILENGIVRTPPGYKEAYLKFIEDSSEFDLQSLGIDAMISPENLASEEVKLLVNESGFTNSHDFEEGALKMMAAKIQNDAPFVGKTVMEAASVFPGIKFMPITGKKHQLRIKNISNT